MTKQLFKFFNSYHNKFFKAKTINSKYNNYNINL